jgi:MATE family multidrug resistance protein
MIRFFRNLWYREGGYKELLITAAPLILSTASWSVLQFTDRVFLTWYSPDAVAASMPAGIVNFTFTCLFFGTASYVGTFVAQYYGACEYHKIGKSLWQGLYISLIGSAVLFIIGFAAEPMFRIVDHSPEVQKLEVIYFKILCFGSLGPIASSVFSGFYSGRGENWPVMWISFISAGVNIILDYVLIFGRFGFPEMGVEGAAIATVIAGFTPLAIYFFLVFGREYNAKYKTLSSYKFDSELFSRILKFGLPSGIHMFIEVAGFSGFLLIVGRLGTTELAATNIALNINTIAFMPMIGFGIAISMLTGQNIGKGSLDIAERVIWSGFQICFVYMALIAATYFFFPGVYIYPFEVNAEPAGFVKIHEYTIILLKFVAVYSLFDTLNLVFASAIKGAGDTRFVMMMGLVLSLLLLVIPSYIAVVIMGRGLYTVWMIASVYITLLGFSYLTRFLTGRWKSMKVIEHIPVLPASCPDVPYIDL